MRAWIWLSPLAWLLVARPAPAEACSCDRTPPEVSPADTATGVPLNALVIARVMYANEIRVELREQVTNTLVPLTGAIRYSAPGSPGRPAFVGVPDAPLSANTTYVITVAIDFPFPAEQASTFTTGTTVDTVPPTFAGLTAMSAETMTYPIGGCYNSCVTLAGSDHVSRIHLEHAGWPSDAVYLGLELVPSPGQSAAVEVAIDRRNPNYLGFELCEANAPLLVPDTNYCGRLSAYDIAGNRAGHDVEVCVTAKRCYPMESPFGLCEPSDECPASAPDGPDGGGTSDGCAAVNAPGWLAVLALAPLRRRRRRR